ncbi:MAG: carboxypeptidase regulatory-like domain-containing protein, partial [Caldilineaceae bacterium]|nr:carboxypeptidase regulatory-like domain-containing protein [Caldilineaceae bacterium]
YELENVFVSSLYDDDGDGTYVGSFVYNRPAQAAAATSVDAGDTVELVVESGGVERRFAAEAVPMTQGTIHNGVDSQPVAAATVSALVANGDGFSAIGSTESSAPDAQQTGADGGYGFQVADGTYRLQVEANGYQPYRSGDITVDNGVLATDINLSPAIAAVANHIVYVTANGFEPAVVNAEAGDVIFWVNSDLAEHSVQVDGWNSGLLAVGEGYKAQVMDPGTITVTDGENALATGTIVVADPGSTGGTGETQSIFLPLVMR